MCALWWLLTDEDGSLLAMGWRQPNMFGRVHGHREYQTATARILTTCFADYALQVFGQVAVQIAAPTEAKVGVARTLRNMQAKYHEQMAPLLAQLPQEQQTALQMLVSS